MIYFDICIFELFLHNILINGNKVQKLGSCWYIICKKEKSCDRKLL